MNGHDAIDQAKRMRPDVMTLDIEMPNMNGLEVLDYMMAQDPLPIIMVSAMTEAGAELTLQALERGAVDFITKPKTQTASEIESWEGLLQAKVREAFQTRSRLSIRGHTDEQQQRSVNQTSPDSGRRVTSKSVGLRHATQLFNNHPVPNHSAEFPILVIGASTGGPNLLKSILRDLPLSFSAALLIIQHMPKYFTKVFAENLNAVAAMPISEAQDGVELRPGEGFVAPGNQHVVISREKDGRPRVRFTNKPLEQPYRPSIDCAMASAAEQFGQSTVGLVLTGMGSDGMAGSEKVKEHGGTVLVQDEATSLIYGMPRAVIDAGLADRVIPADQLASVLVETIDSMRRANA